VRAISKKLTGSPRSLESKPIRFHRRARRTDPGAYPAAYEVLEVDEVVSGAPGDAHQRGHQRRLCDLLSRKHCMTGRQKRLRCHIAGIVSPLKALLNEGKASSGQHC
jgi:hypothetical protein